MWEITDISKAGVNAEFNIHASKSLYASSAAWRGLLFSLLPKINFERRKDSAPCQRSQQTANLTQACSDPTYITSVSNCSSAEPPECFGQVATGCLSALEGHTGRAPGLPAAAGAPGGGGRRAGGRLRTFRSGRRPPAAAAEARSRGGSAPQRGGGADTRGPGRPPGSAGPGGGLRGRPQHGDAGRPPRDPPSRGSAAPACGGSRGGASVTPGGREPAGSARLSVGFILLSDYNYFYFCLCKHLPALEKKKINKSLQPAQQKNAT